MGILTDNQGNLRLGIIIPLILLIIIVGGGLLASVKTVGSGHVGVITTFGKVEERVLAEGGPYIITPFVQDVIEMNVQTQKSSAPVDAGSHDAQTVHAQVTINYRIDPLNANQLYRNLRFNYEATVIAPAIQESVKAATAQFPAIELLTKRNEVKLIIFADLKQRLSQYFIIIDKAENVLIEDFDFSDQFNQAIEAKVTAEQKALEARNDLQRIEIEAQQKVATARGTAESIRLEAQARANATILDATARAEALKLQKVEVTELLNQYKAIEKWDGHLPPVIGGGATPLLDMSRLFNFTKVYP